MKYPHFVSLLTAGLSFLAQIASGIELITLNTEYTASIAYPGHETKFAIDGSRGQLLYLDSLQTNATDFFAKIVTPGGWTIIESYIDYEPTPFYLPQDGLYSLTIYAQNDSTGSVVFRVLDVSTQPLVVTNATNEVTLLPRSKTEIRRFLASAGQRVALESVSYSDPDAYWMLVDPACNVTASGRIDTHLGTNILRASGTYLVIVKGSASAGDSINFRFRIRDVSDPQVAVSGFNLVHSGTIEDNQTNAFTFIAPAGTPVYYDALVPQWSASIGLQIVGPDGSVLKDKSSAGYATIDDGPFVLPRAGTYTVKLIGYSSGYYRFKLINLWSNSIPVSTFGTTNLGVFGDSNAAVVFKIDATASQRIFYDTLLYEGKPTVKIWSATMNDDGWYSPGSGDFWWNVRSPESLYLILSSDRPDSDAPFAFRILSLDNPPVVSVALNTLVSNVLNKPREAHVYRFTPTKDQRLFIDFTSQSQGYSRIYDPSGTMRQSWLGEDYSIESAVSDTYIIVLAPYDDNEAPNETYSFKIVSITTSTTNALVFGIAYSNVIAAVGEEHVYTFQATAGTRLYYDGLLDTPARIPVRLQAPDGSGTWGLTDADANSDSITTLNRSGTYKLIVGGQTDATGPYRFRLINIDSPPAVPIEFGTVYRGTNNPYESMVFRVPVTAGNHLYFDSQAPTWSGYWEFYDVEGSLNAGNWLYYDMDPTPGGNGFAVLVIQALHEPCPFAIRVLDPSRITNELVVGDTITNQFADGGDIHTYTFHGVAGQRVYFDALDYDYYGNDVYLRLTTSDGRQLIWNGDKNSDFGFTTLPYTGIYLLQLRNRSDSAISYRFKILDLASQPTLAIGSPTTGELTPDTQTRTYRFQATAGRKIQFISQSASSDRAYWSVQDPFNNTIASGNIRNQLGTVLCPVTGTYALIIQGTGDGNQSLSYQILAEEVSETPVPPSGFGTYTGYIDPNQTNFAYVEAAAGTPIFIDSLINNWSANVRLIAPDGSTLLHENASSGADEPGFCILPTSGRYTLEIEGYNGGDYAFRVLDLSSAPLLTLNTECAGTFTNAYQTEVYRLAGTLPQSAYYDALTNGQDVYICLLRADGRPIVGSMGWNYYAASAYSDHGIINLSEGGPFYLAVMNPSEQTPSYKFRILDLSSITLINLNSYYTNTLPPFETLVVGFTNPAGKYFFDQLAFNYWVQCSHIPPYSETAYTGWGSDFESESTVGGTNFVLIANSGQDTQTWAFRIIYTPSLTNDLSLGAVYSNQLSPGQDHWFRFTGTQGQTIYFDSYMEYRGWIRNWQVTLIEPTGYTLWSGNYWDNSRPIKLLHSGTYWLKFHNYADEDVPYIFRVLDIGSQPVIALDQIYTGPVSPGTSARVFRFTPSPGVTLFLDLLPEFSGYPQIFIYDPSLNQINQRWGGDFKTTPAADGTHILIFDNYQNDEPYSYSFQLLPGNHPPSFTSPNVASATEQTTFWFTNSVVDPEAPNDKITFSLAGNIPNGLSINPATGLITWTPTEAQGPSTNYITVIATDDGTPPMASSTTLTIVVNEWNQPPSITVPTNQIINELATMQVYITASDPDTPTNSLQFAIVEAPTGVSVNPNSGLLTWTPTEMQGPSTNIIKVKVIDTNHWAINEKQLSATNSFTVVVNEVNSPPSLPTQTNRTINELSTLTVTNTASDPDFPPNSISYQLLNPPQGASISTNGVFSWTPSETQGPGSYTITTIATDNGDPQLSTTNSFVITVNEVNSPPNIYPISNYQVNPGQIVTFQALASDPDWPTNRLTFSLAGGPTSSTITSNGLFYWRPGVAFAGTSNLVTIKVTDDGIPALTATQTFTIRVNPLTPVKLTYGGVTNGTFYLGVVQGTIGPEYVLQTSTNLAAPESWHNIFTNQPTSIPFELADPVHSNHPTKFYRVKLQP